MSDRLERHGPESGSLFLWLLPHCWLLQRAGAHSAKLGMEIQKKSNPHPCRLNPPLSIPMYSLLTSLITSWKCSETSIRVCRTLPAIATAAAALRPYTAFTTMLLPCSKPPADWLTQMTFSLLLGICIRRRKELCDNLTFQINTHTTD